MEVHILTHRWNDNESDGINIAEVFANINEARISMKEKASAKKKEIENSYDNLKWDDDLTWDAPDAVYMGWYEKGCEPDFSWSWEIETRQVVE